MVHGMMHDAKCNDASARLLRLQDASVSQLTPVASGAPSLEPFDALGGECSGRYDIIPRVTPCVHPALACYNLVKLSA